MGMGLHIGCRLASRQSQLFVGFVVQVCWRQNKCMNLPTQRRYSVNFWVGVCHRYSETLTLHQTDVQLQFFGRGREDGNPGVIRAEVYGRREKGYPRGLELGKQE